VFATFAISTVAFALGCALIFALFWIGVALLLLVPTLFVTSSVGVLVYIWAMASVVVARWLYSVAPNNLKAAVKQADPKQVQNGLVEREEKMHVGTQDGKEDGLDPQDMKQADL
jgi:hypothetical protein